MTTATRHPVIARSGVFFLACGLAARLLIPDDLPFHRVSEATAVGLLLLGSGLVLLDHASRGRAAASAVVLVMPALLLVAVRPADAFSVKRAIDVWAACAAGFALGELARGRGLTIPVRRGLAIAAVALSLFGLAQTLFLRNEVAQIAQDARHPITLYERPLAFMMSWRAAATFISPNAFGGFLVLIGMPVLFAAGAALASPARAWARALLGGAAAIVIGGLVCAGSAGATLAGVAGALGTGALTARGRTRGWCLAALAACAALVGWLVSAALSGTDLSGKLRTLQERLDYHKAGLRVLADTWPRGAGLEQTRELMGAATRPGEAFSRSIHDWWLQGLVEGGVAFLPVGIVLAWTIARGVRRATNLLAAQPAAAPGPDRRDATAWWAGLAAGALIALVLVPFVAVVPYGSGPPIAVSLVTWAAFAGAGALVRRLPLDDPAWSRGLAAGCLGFALHGLVDFDLYAPGVMVAFAAALALLPGPAVEDEAAPRPSPIACVLTGAIGLICVLAPLAVVMLARTRERPL